MSKGAKKRLSRIQGIEQKAVDALDGNDLTKRAVAFYRNYAALLRVRQAESLLK